MHRRVTKRVLEKMVARLNVYESRPIYSHTPVYNPETNVSSYMPNEGHLMLDCDEGYQLRYMTATGGQDTDYPCWGRLTAREMYYYLAGRLND